MATFFTDKYEFYVSKGIVHEWPEIVGMREPEFGNVMAYHPSDDPKGLWSFMFIAKYESGAYPYLRVMVIKVPPDDDGWAVGDIVTAGTNELRVVE